MQFTAQQVGQITCGAQHGDRETRRRLIAVAQVAKYGQSTRARSHIIAAGANVLVITEHRSEKVKSGIGRETAVAAHLVVNRVDIVIVVQINNALPTPR